MPLLRSIALGAVLAVSIPARAPLAKGFTYDLVQRTESANPMNGGSQDLVTFRAHVQVDATGRTRIDIVEAARNPLWSKGTYILTSGTSILIVSPERKETLDPGLDFGASAVMELTKSMGMDMKISDGAIVLDTLPGTETVNDHAARHFHLTREATMQMTTPMGAMDVPTKTEIEYYVTRDRAPQNNPIVGASLSISPTSMMSPQTLEKMRATVSGMKGFIVRIVSRSTTTIMGMNQESTSTTDIQNLLEVEVAPISIAPPAGYTKVDLADRLRTMGPRRKG